MVTHRKYNLNQALPLVWPLQKIESKGLLPLGRHTNEECVVKQHQGERK
jgi:hypothetical protein